MRQDQDKLAETANEAMARIEEGGGEYVASHWSAVEMGTGFINSLVIVYREAEGPGEVWVQ